MRRRNKKTVIELVLSYFKKTGNSEVSTVELFDSLSPSQQVLYGGMPSVIHKGIRQHILSRSDDNRLITYVDASYENPISIYSKLKVSNGESLNDYLKDISDGKVPPKRGPHKSNATKVNNNSINSTREVTKKRKYVLSDVDLAGSKYSVVKNVDIASTKSDVATPISYIIHMINKLKSEFKDRSNLDEETKRHLEMVDRDAEIITALFAEGGAALPQTWVDSYLSTYADDYNTFSEMATIFKVNNDEN
jgi:hypothetical protein